METWRPPIPTDEADRLADLRRLDILLTEPEPPLDRMTRQLARIFDVPGAFISFIDEDTQHYKSEVGLPPAFAATRTEPREISLCSYVVGTNETLVVEDLAGDERFRASPAVQDFGMRFYAGAPLRGEQGHGIGSLCIVDLKPRTITEREREMLVLLAEGVMAHVRLQSASRHLLRRTVQIERDLHQARHVQRSLLPPARVESAAWCVRHRYHPADQLGGDFVDVIRRDDGGLTVLLADVSGHGTSAALTATMTKLAFQRSAPGATDPGAILTAVHRELEPIIPAGQFITALAILAEPGSASLRIASAGHPPPLQVRGASVAPAPTENEPPLLVVPGHAYTRECRVEMSGPQRLLAYTDGATEARDGDGRMLGIDGLARLAASVGADGEGFLDAVLAGVRAHANGRLEDDLALLTIEVA